MKPPKKLASEQLWAYAVKLLAARGMSGGELRSKLYMKALERGDVDGIVVRLKEYGYLDDKRFAEAYAAARLGNEGLGKTRVLRDLRQKRVAPSLAESVVQTVYSGQDETALIEAYIRRKYRSADRTVLFQADKDLAAAYRRLLRAGFGSANIVRVLKNFASNPELLDVIEESEEDNINPASL